MDQTCKTCRFFDFLDDQNGKAAFCRKNPPALGSRAWPTVLDTDWCGEYQPKEIVPAQCPYCHQVGKHLPDCEAHELLKVDPFRGNYSATRRLNYDD